MSTLSRPSPAAASVPLRQQHPNKKRSRGRPTGSSRFTETDQTSLEKIADALVREPGLQPTIVIRRLGYDGEAEIRRLQNKWRKERHRLLAEAQRRLDAEPPKTWLDMVTDTLGTLTSFVNGLATSPAMQSLKARLDRQARRRTALDELGIAPRSPIEPGNQEDLERAIERFEERPHQSVSDLIADLPAEMTADEMPLSLRLYAMALMLHELALDAKHSEAAAIGRTSAAILDVARETGMRLVERPFSIHEALDASEAFITSASAFVLPVVQLDGQTLGSGAVGPVAARLREIYIGECMKSAR